MTPGQVAAILTVHNRVNGHQPGSTTAPQPTAQGSISDLLNLAGMRQPIPTAG